MKLTSFEQFIATVPINVSQILLNLPRRVFSNTFRRSSDRPSKAICYLDGYKHVDTV